MQALFLYVLCVCQSNRVFDNREMEQDTEVEITIIIALNLLKYQIKHYNSLVTRTQYISSHKIFKSFTVSVLVSSLCFYYYSNHFMHSSAENLHA